MFLRSIDDARRVRMKNLLKKSIIYIATVSLMFTSNPFYAYADEIAVDDGIVELDEAEGIVEVEDTSDQEEELDDEEAVISDYTDLAEAETGVEEYDDDAEYIDVIPEGITEDNQESDGMVNSYIESQKEIEGFPIVAKEHVSDLLPADGAIPTKYITSGSIAPLTRNQNPFGTCWSFAAIALSEFDSIKDGRGTVDSVDNSELHLEYYSYSIKGDYFKGISGDGTLPKGIVSSEDPEAPYAGKPENFLTKGGNYAISSNTLLNWIGTVDESVAPYNRVNAEYVVEHGLDDATANASNTAHLQQLREFNIKGNPELVKAWIMEHGAVGASYWHDDKFYRADTNSYYNNKDDKTSHAIALVGWDDDYPASNFNNAPDRNGAWLIRNSWQEGQNIDSRSLYTYFWISYADKSLSGAYGMDFEAADNYDNIHAYDGGSFTYALNYPDDGLIKGANIFAAEGYEEIAAVGTYVYNADVPLKISIYTNLTDASQPDSGTLQKVIKTTTTNSGYYTFKLSDYGVPNVKLIDGSKYAVVIEYGAGSDGKSIAPVEISDSSVNFDDIAKSKPGESYYTRVSSANWNDCNDQEYGNIRIKTYTNSITPQDIVYPTSIAFKGDITTKSPTILVGKSYTPSYEVLPSDAVDKTVVWSSSNKSVATVDKNGKVTGKKPGKAKITATSKISPDVTKSYVVIVNNYSITYVLNGGTNSKKNPVGYDKNHTVIKFASPKKTGYTFKGWYTDKKFKSSSKITEIKRGAKGNLKLYAKWEANTYKVKFNANGGKGSMSAASCTYGKNYKLSANKFTRKGYKFVGWATSKSDAKKNKVTYKNKASIKNLSSKKGATVTLYAVWKKK